MDRNDCFVKWRSVSKRPPPPPPPPPISEIPSSTQWGGQHANHSVIICPSKIDKHQLNGITYWSKQRVLSGRIDSSLDCLLMALTYRYGLVWRLLTGVALRLYFCVCTCAFLCACFVLHYHICSTFPAIDTVYLQHGFCYEHNSLNLFPRSRYHNQ